MRYGRSSKEADSESCRKDIRYFIPQQSSGILRKAYVHYAAVSGYGFGRAVGQRLCTLLQENLTVFLAKYPLYDVEPWSKTIRAAIAALFFCHKPLISRPDKLRRFIL